MKGIIACVLVFIIMLSVVVLTVLPLDVGSALARGHYRFAAQKLEAQRTHNDSRLHPKATTTLANLYFIGLGVEQNYLRSAQLYSEAAFAGHVAAQVNMGHLYANGYGVDVDGNLAYAWFNLARNNGSKIAQDYMSDLLAQHKVSGHHVPKIREQYATLSNFPKLH